jgi:hypothetical protein
MFPFSIEQHPVGGQGRRAEDHVQENRPNAPVEDSFSDAGTAPSATPAKLVRPGP